MAWRCRASRATGPVRKPWTVRPRGRKPWPTRLGEAAVPVARANRQWAYLWASESPDDAPHSPRRSLRRSQGRPRLPSCPPLGPTHRPRDLHGSISALRGISPKGRGDRGIARPGRRGPAVFFVRRAGNQPRPSTLTILVASPIAALPKPIDAAAVAAACVHDGPGRPAHGCGRPGGPRMRAEIRRFSVSTNISIQIQINFHSITSQIKLK